LSPPPNPNHQAASSFEVADLASEQFDPVLREADEPDWGDPDKVYSEEVQREMRRIERNDATVMVFPVYWWSMRALLKGWIDRVWNNGWAYGKREFPQQRVWMIGIAGGLPDSFAKRGYDTAIRTQLDIGILDYCGVRERRLQLLHGSIEGEDIPCGSSPRRVRSALISDGRLHRSGVLR
jgi:NAD(P)H dehydrogenase (quinone)